jgi:hypothetical protein
MSNLAINPKNSLVSKKHKTLSRDSLEEVSWNSLNSICSNFLQSPSQYQLDLPTSKKSEKLDKLIGWFKRL